VIITTPTEILQLPCAVYANLTLYKLATGFTENLSIDYTRGDPWKVSHRVSYSFIR